MIAESLDWLLRTEIICSRSEWLRLHYCYFNGKDQMLLVTHPVIEFETHRQ